MAEYIRDISECNKAFEDLRSRLNYWLNPVRKQLEQALNIQSGDEINVVIHTDNISSESTKQILPKLPWHWWIFFSENCFADIAISFSNSEHFHSIYSEKMSALPRPKRVKILCILGDTTGIDVEADRRLLREISGAYCVFLRQPTRLEFFEFMKKERWDILFFSGHSETDKDSNTGLLYLNAEETLDIQEIREIIQAAINQYQGMKLAIFNSCDGLGLARQLADLDIAQIIVWREPFPDKIAQEFLKSFLEFFTGSLSLYRSVQQARIQVQNYIENPERNEQLPKISWLPVIHQNLAKEEITWRKLRGYIDAKIIDIKKQNNPRQNLLDKVDKYWVEGILKKALHLEKAVIELGLEEHFDVVTANQRENPNQEKQDLPEGTRAIDIFGELKNKRTMLILGEPGSGKTTALLEIAQELIRDAKQNTDLPIPVVLNISSWAGERRTKPLADWLVQELNRIYQFSKEQCKSWVRNQQLLLLLDGLDEVRESQRGACIQKINEFLRENDKTEMVVCCRIQDYNEVSDKLQLQSAVFYKQLTEEQINRYLDDAGDALSGVKELKEEDKAIQELVKSPLTLNIIAVAYEGKKKLLPINSLSERRNHLLDTYIERRFEEEQESQEIKYPKKQSLHWLNWLAQRMIQKSQEVLLIEQIQHDSLQTTNQKRMYLIGSRLILGLIVGLIAFLHFSTLVTSDLGAQISLVIPSVIAGLASGLSSLVLSIFIPRIIRRFRPRHISRFIPRAIRDRFKPQDISRFIPGVMSGLISGLIYVIIAAPMVYAIVEKSYKWREVISPLIIDGFVLGIFFTLISQEIGIIDTIKTSWEKAIKYSVVGLIWGSIYVLARLLFSNRYDLGNLDDLFDIFIELLIFTILPGLIGFLDKGVNLEQTIIPNQGVWRSAKNACLFFGIFFPVGMLCSLNYVKGQNHEVISIGLAVGLLAGLVGGKGPVFAGLVLIQHFTLRVILWLQGYTPWNYARFLDYATERIFLRKVGGGYIFIHQTLKEHFAQKE
ncbi:MAG: NACHT domain-containing protein [Calothrix sp. MO_167.B12]|nr:NACHT domain-containing protein [Calothrix sp. MO_167.B12]